MLQFGLKGKVAFISGAGRGLGRAIALAYAEQGANLVLCSRTPEELQEVAKQAQTHGARVETLRVDMGKFADSAADIDAAIQRMGSVDILVNNVGGGLRGKVPATEVTDAQWNEVFDRSLKGPFFLTQLVGKKMIPQGRGAIINISSLASLVGKQRGHLYSAAKAAVNSLTMSLAVEWGRHGITVNAILPSYVRTAATEASCADPATLAPFLARTPLGRFPEVDDIAAAAVYFASDAGRNVSGQLLAIDGGRSIEGG